MCRTKYRVPTVRIVFRMLNVRKNNVDDNKTQWEENRDRKRSTRNVFLGFFFTRVRKKNAHENAVESPTTTTPLFCPFGGVRNPFRVHAAGQDLAIRVVRAVFRLVVPSETRDPLNDKRVALRPKRQVIRSDTRPVRSARCFAFRTIRKTDHLVFRRIGRKITDVR